VVEVLESDLYRVYYEGEVEENINHFKGLISCGNKLRENWEEFSQGWSYSGRFGKAWAEFWITTDRLLQCYAARIAWSISQLDSWKVKKP